MYKTFILVWYVPRLSVNGFYIKYIAYVYKTDQGNTSVLLKVFDVIIFLQPIVDNVYFILKFNLFFMHLESATKSIFT